MPLTAEQLRGKLAEMADDLADAYRLVGEARSRMWDAIAATMRSGKPVEVHGDLLIAGEVQAAELRVEYLLRVWREAEGSYWMLFGESGDRLSERKG